MTKHNMIQNDNILKRFLMYDLDNHCERLSKYILSLTIRKIQILFISHHLTSENFADIIYNIEGGKITKV